MNVDIPLAEVRVGCALLIERVRRHAEDAKVLLDRGRDGGAFVLILIGFEELGKLLEYIQAAAQAEMDGMPTAKVRDYRDRGLTPRERHEEKAGLSSEYFLRFVSIVLSALRTAGWDEATLASYSDHLSAIGADFARLRRLAMYVDWEHGAWTVPRATDKETLSTDVLGLLLGTGAIEVSLKKHPDFRGIVSEFADLEMELRRQLPEFFSEVNRALREAASATNDEDT